MNTKQIEQTRKTASHVQQTDAPKTLSAKDLSKLQSQLLHEAEIITPHPYGVFSLCKIFEHFQVN